MKLFNLAALILCGFCLKISGQSHSTILKRISRDTLYKISLPPAYKQHMAADMHDVRIFNSKKQEVPYIILSEPSRQKETNFIAYEIVSQTHFKTFSEIVISNKNKDKISNIAFNINNSDAYKYCSVEGSNDGKQWYAISELQELSLLYNGAYTNQYKAIYFPLSDYLYFRLTVDDWLSHPLKINSAGYFKNSVIAGKFYDVLYSKEILQNEKSKTTTIHFKFNNNQAINRLDFTIKAPRLFLRQAIIYVNRQTQIKNKHENYREELAQFEINSDKPFLFDVTEINEKEFFVEIKNKDNQPMQIEDVKCKQLASFLVCDLNANETYSLTMGNKNLKTPEYDLQNFITQVPQLLPEAALCQLIKIESNIPKPQVKNISFYETSQFLWVCLAIGCIVIFLFSRSLLKDMGENQNEK